MSRIDPAILNLSDRAVLTFLLPKTWVMQEQIADHITQTAGGFFDAQGKARPAMETLEKLANFGLIERNPQAGRQWGLSVEGETVARKVIGDTEPAQVRRDRAGRAATIERAAAQAEGKDAAADEAPESDTPPPARQRARYGRKADRSAPDAE